MGGRRIAGAVLVTTVPPALVLAGIVATSATDQPLWFMGGGFGAVLGASSADGYARSVTGSDSGEWFAPWTATFFRQVTRDSRLSWTVAAAPSWALVGLLALGWVTLVVLGIAGADTDGS